MAQNPGSARNRTDEGCYCYIADVVYTSGATEDAEKGKSLAYPPLYEPGEKVYVWNETNKTYSSQRYIIVHVKTNRHYDLCDADGKSTHKDVKETDLSFWNESKRLEVQRPKQGDQSEDLEKGLVPKDSASKLTTRIKNYLK